MSHRRRRASYALPVAVHRAYAVMFLLGTFLLAWLFGGRSGTLEPYQMLVADGPTLEGFLTHQLFHTSGLHLTINMAVVLVAGGLLENYWGTPKFLVFGAIVLLGAALASLAVGDVASSADRFGEVSPKTYGGSALAFACLVCMAVAFPRREVCRGLSVPQVVWTGILLGAAGILVLDRAAQSGPSEMEGTFLVPQVSGVGFALFFLWLSPRVDRYREDRKLRDETRRKEKLEEIRLQVDQLLDKIHAQGSDSLTVSERNFLKQASKHYKQEN